MATTKNINELLETGCIYLVARDHLLPAFAPSEYVYILFELPADATHEMQQAVQTNVSKDDEIGGILFGGRFVRQGRIADFHFHRASVFHKKTDGKWFEPDAVKTEDERFIDACVEHFGSTSKDARAFLALAQESSPKLHRYNEIDCDCGLSDLQQRRADVLKIDLRAAARKASIKVRFNGDPRGRPIKVTFPKGGPSNDMGGDWGI